ncbi:4Fe-4S binding protein [Candidatus Pacearchaeota archaeon]|nr:4Fe-4S binding protein [Candidatus Pacearchaeota archaeon]
MAQIYDHYKNIPDFPEKITEKKKKPKLMAVVNEGNCTGCEVCVPFCPVDCIEKVPREKYDIPIPPVQIRFNECIGCQICARVCTQLTWDAIEMMPTNKFEEKYGIGITESKHPAYGIPIKS